MVAEAAQGRVRAPEAAVRRAAVTSAAARAGGLAREPWARAFGDDGSEFFRAMAISPTGDIHLSGSFSGDIDFGDQPLSSTDTADVYIAKLRPDGTTLWSRRYGDQGLQLSQGIALDTDASSEASTAPWTSVLVRSPVWEEQICSETSLSRS